MKKVFLSLAAIALVACLSSCKKTCNCTTYSGGQTVQTQEVDMPSSGKCADMTNMQDISGIGKTGIECK